MRQSLEGVGTFARWVAARSTGVHVAASQLKLGVPILAAPFPRGVSLWFGEAYGAATGSRDAGVRE
jgi:hypothetical protein